MMIGTKNEVDQLGTPFKYFLILFVLTSGCDESSSVLEPQGVLGGQPLEYAPSRIKDPLKGFFSALHSKDYKTVYDYASVEYSSTIPFSTFEKSFLDKWKLSNVEILSISQFSRSFYLILKVGSKKSLSAEIAYCVMFWRITDEGIRFKNFPFTSSGVSQFGEIPDFFIE